MTSISENKNKRTKSNEYTPVHNYRNDKITLKTFDILKIKIALIT